MSGRARASMRKVAGFMVCTILCTALLASPGAWAQTSSHHSKEDEASTPKECSTPDAPYEPADNADDNSTKSADEVPTTQSNSEGDDPASNAANASEAGGLCAAVGDTFTYPITVGTNKNVACTFKITHLNPNEVQVGTGVGRDHDEASCKQAIPKTSSGGLVLPNTVRVKGGISYKVVAVGRYAFSYCANLTDSGLAANTSITRLEEGAYWGCERLEKTGFESNSTISSIGACAFLGCHKLKSTGLDNNYTVTYLGKWAYDSCTRLGTEDTDTANKGDLVLHQSRNKNKITLQGMIFNHTKYRTLYLLCENPDDVECVDDTFNPVFLNLEKVYVPASWRGVTEFKKGGLNLSSANGTLIVMDPKLTGLKASRVDGTSDSALLSFTTNHGFKTNISKTDSTSLGDYQVSLPATETGQMQEATCTIPTGVGLTPGSEELRASIDKFIYPLDAKAQDYNSFSGTALSCTLDPVTYTIAFVSNGASGTMDNQQVSYKPDNTLNKLAYTMANMAFKHWSTTKDDTEQSITLKDEDSLSNLPLLQGNTITLFAQWQTGLQVLSTHTNSNPLGGVSYELSKTDKKPIQPLEGLSSDPEGQNPIHKEGEEGTCWPLISNEQGKVSMYWLSEGTYYLFNTRVPAGYNAALSPMKVEVSHKDGKAFVTVNGNEVSKYKDATAQMSIAFEESPSLPTTGNLPAGLVQGVGALALITFGGVALRKLRQRC